MSFELAVRATEVLLALAFLQQSAEHMAGPVDERRLFAPRLALAALLLTGLLAPWVCLALAVHALLLLDRFEGPYNGGSDRMGLLVLICLTLAHWLPEERWREMALGYLALQLVLSYFISGWVKLVNVDWRSGRALGDVFLFSAYPVSEQTRGLATQRSLLWCAAWAVMLLELLFPLALLNQPLLTAALAATALFHLANAVLFGLNRFFWIWLAAYPAVIWLQERLTL